MIVYTSRETQRNGFVSYRIRNEDNRDFNNRGLVQRFVVEMKFHRE